MKKAGRYSTSNLVEDQFEPGSNGLVLKNRIGIKTVEEMDKVEAEALELTVDQLVRTYDEDHRFTASDICKIHKLWLGNIYEWAGKYRSVNISKGNFPFAAAMQIPALMDALEKDLLCRYTPCKGMERNALVKALAVVHTELVLIHPFREGNGRVARTISSFMALQAGLPLLDFSAIEGGKKEEYFAAVRAGLDRDYRPMGEIFEDIIRKTISVPLI